jgi:hypothetical protein
MVPFFFFLGAGFWNPVCLAQAEDQPIGNEPLRVWNQPSPLIPLQTLSPHELWRSGGTAGEVIFGFIITALADEDGVIYLLDRQLSCVHVFSPNGKYLQQLSREGDGPGETRVPTDLLLMPDGSLGLVQPIPGQIVQIDREGNPAGTLVPGGASAAVGGVNFLLEVQCQAQQLVCYAVK